jgi:hypothetical protein
MKKNFDILAMLALKMGKKLETVSKEKQDSFLLELAKLIEKYLNEK